MEGCLSRTVAASIAAALTCLIVVKVLGWSWEVAVPMAIACAAGTALFGGRGSR
jgi:hypothetical protein